MKSARIYANDFNKVIDATKNHVSTNCGVRKWQNFIKLEFSAQENKMTAIAVDGYRMSVETCVIDMCEEDFECYILPTVKLKNGCYARIDFYEDDEYVEITCNDFHFGYDQPEKSTLDWKKVLPKNEPTYKIGFNGNYLLQALQAAKVSLGGNFRKPVVLELRSPIEPILLKTNGGEDIKMVLPIRLKDD